MNLTKVGRAGYRTSIMKYYCYKVFPMFEHSLLISPATLYKKKLKKKLWLSNLNYEENNVIKKRVTNEHKVSHIL